MGAPAAVVYQQAPQVVYVQQQPQVVTQMPPRTYNSEARDPFQTNCQFCGHSGFTECEGSMGMKVWTAVLVLFVVGLFVGFTWLCLCVPCCIPSLYEYKHSCAACHQIIAKNE